MRKSTAFIGFTTTLFLLVILMGLHSRYSQNSAGPGRLERAGLVKTLRLTDLCLFTEARYTRHPAMADRFAPYQDHPTALEHFPSGSFVTPPILHKQDKDVFEIISRQKKPENNFTPTQ
jgi:hypothetical protein